MLSARAFSSRVLRACDAVAKIPPIKHSKIKMAADQATLQVLAEVVAAPRRLDLDDIGSHVGEHHRRERARDEVREIDDANPVERGRRTSRPGPVLGKIGYESFQHDNSCGKR